jgi:hypothetical protein
MQANTDVMGTEVQTLPLNWEETRCWAKSRLQSAGIAVAGVSAFLGLVGLVEYDLYQALQNWTVSGLGAAVFGYF